MQEGNLPREQWDQQDHHPQPSFTTVGHLQLDSFRRLLLRFIQGGRDEDDPKTGDLPTRLDSYRPISLLEIHGKIFERVVTNRLRDYMEGECRFSEGQYGFRRSRGTIHAIPMATETLAVHHASRMRCNLVLRDASKSFNKVWHLGL